MPLCSPDISRAKPLLGTTVCVRVHGLEPAHAQAAIDAAFDAVAQVHDAMSFHEPDSDISRLNRDAQTRPIAVSAQTYDVIAHACTISALTDGVFDIAVAPALVARGRLPRPTHAPEPDASASWRDIELLPEHHIRFLRPLWIDLGGIAKGYAVDRAIEALQAFAPIQACVNAGGDLRLAGPEIECVRLAAEDCDSDTVPIVELRNGSLASSVSTEDGPHIHVRRGRAGTHRQFVSVTAPRCIDADALTKLVIARGACSTKSLAAFAANAVVHDAAFGWREIRGHV